MPGLPRLPSTLHSCTSAQLVIDTGDEPEEEVPEAEAEVDCNPTEDELGDLNAACGRLWDLDTNRLVFDEDFAINLQSGVGSWSDNDAAADPLFTFVKDEVFEKPTYGGLRALLDNYEADVGKEEKATQQEMGVCNAVEPPGNGCLPRQTPLKLLVLCAVTRFARRRFGPNIVSDLSWAGLAPSIQCHPVAPKSLLLCYCRPTNATARGWLTCQAVALHLGCGRV